MALSKIRVQSLETRLADPEYANFIKVELCLAEMKSGLEDFCDHTSEMLQKDVKEKLQNMGYKSHMSICETAYVKQAKQPKMNCCQDCTEFIKQLYNYCTQKFRFAFNWKNSTCQDWPKEHKHWSLAKLFMKRRQDKRLMTPADTDAYGILNFMMHCSKSCSCANTVAYVEKVMVARNNLMHRSSLTLSDKDATEMTENMVQLLENLNLCRESKLVTKEHQTDLYVTVLKIQKVRGPTFYINAKIEYKAMDSILHELEACKDGLLEEIKILKDECKRLAIHEAQRNNALLQELEDSIASKQQESAMFTNMHKLLKEKIQNDHGILCTMSQRIEIIGTYANKMAKGIGDVRDIFRDLSTRPPTPPPPPPPEDPPDRPPSPLPVNRGLFASMVLGGAEGAVKVGGAGATVGLVGGPSGAVTGAAVGGVTGAVIGAIGGIMSYFHVR